MQLDPETEFMTEMMKMGFGLDVKDKLLELSKQVDWLQGWPKSDVAFWNAEAFMWSYKINKELREIIFKELSFLKKDNKMNLDLGCGAYSYIPSIGFDISPKMLQLNENCVKKVVGSLEQKLPFAAEEFDSITAIFVLNYVENYLSVLKEVKRILNSKGEFVMVLSVKGVNEWQRQKQVNNLSSKEWLKVLDDVGFKVECYEKKGFLFFKCVSFCNGG
jgi:ubiquinone/menaquinone biosynthesis C-methylase UbiE